MNLNFLIYSYFPHGGQQRDFFRIVQECLARGHQVTVYTMKWEGEMLEGIKLIKVPAKVSGRLKLYRHFTKWVLKDIAERPGSVTIGFNKMPGLDFHFAADPCFAEKADKHRKSYYKFTARFRHFLSYEQAVFSKDSSTQILFLSPQQRNAFLHYYPDCESRLHLMPPGISKDRIITQGREAVRTQFRKEFKLADTDLLILQIGSGFRIKGVDRSLRAIASLPSELRKRVRYLMVGRGKSAYFRNLAAWLGIGRQFTIIPGRDDIPRFLQGADLLLHPAYSESAGYVLLEATVAGLPVLTTATCGYAFHIEQSGCGEVCGEPFKQDELNERLLKMLVSNQRQQWSKNGLLYGTENDLYSQAKTVVDLIEQKTTHWEKKNKPQRPTTPNHKMAKPE